MDIQVKNWNAEEFQRHYYGYDAEGLKRFAPIKLKYWMDPWSYGAGPTEGHQLFGLIQDENQKTVKLSAKNGKHSDSKWAVRGLTELRQREGTNEWAMPYISIDESMRGRTWGTKLFKEAIQWLQEHHPGAILIRTPNSESGMCAQHAFDAICFELRQPWRQDKRIPQDFFDTPARFSDFDAPVEQLIYALQTKKFTQAIHCIDQHPECLNQQSQGGFTPLGYALAYCPAFAPTLLMQGADPMVQDGLIGAWARLTGRSSALNEWIKLLSPEQLEHAVKHQRYLVRIPAIEKALAKECGQNTTTSPSLSQ